IVSRSVPRNARVQRLSATDGPFTRLASRSTLLPSPGAARAVGAPNSHRLGALIAYLGRAYAEKLAYGLAAVRLAYLPGDLHPRVCLHSVADVHHCFKIVSACYRQRSASARADELGLPTRDLRAPMHRS